MRHLSLAFGLILGLGQLVGSTALPGKIAPSNSRVYRSPFDVAYSPSGKWLAVTDRTAHELVILRPATGGVTARIPCPAEPTGLVWGDKEDRLFVAAFGAAQVLEISAPNWKRTRAWAVGKYPIGLALSPAHRLLLVANTFSHSVSFLDANTGQEWKRVPVVREPFAIAVAKDESIALVSNLLPGGRATDPRQGAVVSVLDLVRQEKIQDIQLPAGSSAVRGLTLSSDGKWAYVAHTMGRTFLPTTTLERGWVNNNVLTVIDLARRQHFTTLLLDHPSEGAADPWGVACAADDSALWITAAGIHQLLTLDLATLHRYLDGGIPEDFGMTENVWARIKEDPRNRWALAYDNDALYSAGLVDRISIAGNGPRALARSPDGTQLALALYFSGEIKLVDTATRRTIRSVPLAAQPEPDPVRMGERVFHDASFSFQFWLSCATCHPHDARADGLNWDMLNDGLGNPKNTKSLLLAHQTPPMTWKGVRPDYASSIKKGFDFLFTQPPPEDVAAVTAYVRSQQPVPSPHLQKNGSLSQPAQRGQTLFLDKKIQCARCHPPPLYTDLKSHNVGTRGPKDDTAEFDTPSLVELFRTAPYLHDGSRADLWEVLTTGNPKNQHGQTSHLSDRELGDLIAYLLSL